MDFSSAFNTINTNTLLHRLQGLQVNTTLVDYGIRISLKDRHKHVRVNGFKFRNSIKYWGPIAVSLLLSIYTNMHWWHGLGGWQMLSVHIQAVCGHHGPLVPGEFPRTEHQEDLELRCRGGWHPTPSLWTTQGRGAGGRDLRACGHWDRPPHFSWRGWKVSFPLHPGTTPTKIKA